MGLVLLVVGAVGVALRTVFADSWPRSAARPATRPRNRSPGRTLAPFVRAPTVVQGVAIRAAIVTAGSTGLLFAELRAACTPGPGPRLLRAAGWQGRPLPPGAGAVDSLASALPALDATWLPAMEANRHLVLACDGHGVVAWLDEPSGRDAIRAAMAAVAAVARWDAALAAVLAALPDATPLADAELSPAVTIAPEGIRVGVRQADVVAEVRAATDATPQVAGCTVERDGATVRLRWRGIERDPVRLQAGVDALRAVVASTDAPYR